jgi:hypothetical protein
MFPKNTKKVPEEPRIIAKLKLNTYWVSQAQASSSGTPGFHSQVSPDCGITSSLSQSTVVL